MRLIDGDALIEILTTAIRNVQGVTKLIGAEDDPEIKMAIKCYTDILNGVKEQPTIEPEPHWIPCSKRPPEAGVRYQVTFESGEVGYADFRNKIFLSDGSAKENVWEVERYYEDDGEVIAWMPLPEPYKGEQHG